MSESHEYSVYAGHHIGSFSSIEIARAHAKEAAIKFGYAIVSQDIETYKRVTEVKVVKS